MSKTWIFVFSMTFVVVGLGAAPCHAEDAESNRALLAKLAEPARNFEFFEAPLSEVLIRIKEDHEIPLVIDEKGLGDRDVDSQMLAVTRSLKGISLGSALNIILADVGLGWTLQNECVVVTSQEKASRHLIRRTYAVQDLVRHRSGADRSGFDELIELLKTTVAPETWTAPVRKPGEAATEPPHRPGAIGVSHAAGALVILQSVQVHGEIEDLLRTLRETRAAQALDAPTALRPPSARVPDPGLQLGPSR